MQLARSEYVQSTNVNVVRRTRLQYWNGSISRRVIFKSKTNFNLKSKRGVVHQRGTAKLDD